MHTKEIAIEIGSTHLVNLSSRVTQNAYNRLEEIQALLQIERPLSRVSKQECLEHAINFYHACKMQELLKMDEEAPAESMQIASIVQESIPDEIPLHAKSMQTESKKHFITPSGLTIEQAAEISNKNLHAKSMHIASKQKEPEIPQVRSKIKERLGIAK